MVIAHPRYNGLRDNIGGLVEYEVCANRVKLGKDKGVVLVNTDFICPCLFVSV